MRDLLSEQSNNISLGYHEGKLDPQKHILVRKETMGAGGVDTFDFISNTSTSIIVIVDHQQHTSKGHIM